MSVSSLLPTAGDQGPIAVGELELVPAGLLASVTDPRVRRGVRHRFCAILGIAVCAVLSGAQSYTAIAEWRTT